MNTTTKEEWEMTRKTAVAMLVVISSTIMVGAAGVTTTPAGSASNRHASANGLAGTWVQTVNRPAPLPPLRSMQVINRGGTALETSNEPPGTRSPMFSTWKHIGGRLYAATGVHFLFDPHTGEFQGTRKINRTIELARDGQSLKTVARVTTMDPLGNVVGTFIARASAERMQLEVIPDLP
jgi:hypothetical protein